MTEDTFITPDAWRRSILPRRGGLPVGHRTVADWKATVVKSISGRNDPRAALTHDKTPEDVRAAGLAHLAARHTRDPRTDAGSTPLGAAAVAVTAVGPPDLWSSAVSSAFADGWVATHGLAFAVQAGLELADLRHGKTHHGQRQGQVARFGRAAARLGWDIDGTTLLLCRLRVAMAAATEDEHAAAVEALAAARERPLTTRQRAVTSFLAPGRHDWVAADVELVGGERDGVWAALLLHASITEPAQFAALQFGEVEWHLMRFPRWLHTLAEGLGAAGLPAFRTLLSTEAAVTVGARHVLALVAVVPTDEAFQLLIDWPDDRAAMPVLVEAADRFPRRALRLLATTGRSGAAALFRTHTSKHRDLAERVSGELPPAVADRIAAVTARLAGTREAPAEALPPVLADPPWLGAAKARKPVVVAGLTCTDETVVRWEPGERAVWQRPGRHSHGQLSDTAMRRIAVDLRAGRSDPYRLRSFFLQAPEDVARPLLPAWRPESLWDAEFWLPIVVARYEAAAWPVVLEAARRSPSTVAPAVLPFAGPGPAQLVAEWLGRLKTLRPAATQWLHRHPRTAARALVPPALGKPGPARRHAEQALLVLAAAGHRDLVQTAAHEHGDAAAAGIAQLLDTDPLLRLPAKIPALPDWADPAQFAPVELAAAPSAVPGGTEVVAGGGAGVVPGARGVVPGGVGVVPGGAADVGADGVPGGGAGVVAGGVAILPGGAVRHLLTILAMSKLGEPYAGLAQVLWACEPGSLARFGWSLFEQWRLVGSPPKDGWVLDALGFLGDDDTVRRLAPVIRAWPGEGGHSKAVAGLDVLAEIGTDVALMHLHGIAEKAKFKGLKDRAKDKIAEVAVSLELTPDQLADRLVPDFGLDADGTLTIDYGPRRFTVGFDEQLKPFVADETGARRKDLPKPAAKDDPDLAPAGAARFAALKKDVRTVAADQLHRFEQAMVMQRRWSGAEFRQLILGHPLVWHVARRLVWAAFDAGGAPVGTMRLAEDRSLAAVDEKAVVLADDAVVGVAHPVHLAGTLSAWAEVFADYEILQPFPQLGRDTHTLTEAERVATDLTRYHGVKVPTTKILGLQRRGWLRAEAEDGGIQPAMERPLPGGALLIADLDPGIVVGDVTAVPEQALSEVWILGGGGSRWTGDRPHTFGELDPVTVSEIIRDLREVMQ